MYSIMHDSKANSKSYRAFNVGQNINMGYAISSPSATSGGGPNNSPVCTYFIFFSFLLHSTISPF